MLTIRADSTPTIGAGHVMRMIALAQAWTDLGGRVRFVGEVERHGALLDKEGFEVVSLESPSQQKDRQVLYSLVQDSSWLAIDGYQFDKAYQHDMRAAGFKTLVVDDVCDRGQYEADILLNYTPNAAESPYDINSDAELLLGSRFTLLRREFRKYPTHATSIPAKARNLLLTMGGADPADATSAALTALSGLDADELHIKVVLGPSYQHRNRLTSALGKVRFTTEVLSDVADMAPLMSWADLAVTAAGSTCWELCALGVPFICVRTADNQRGVCAETNARGAGICIGGPESMDTLATLAEALLNDQAKRRGMATAGKQLVDGSGASRVAKRMYCSGITLRPATQHDADLLLTWRNHPITRCNSLCQDEIDRATHLEWLDSRLNSSDCHLFIAQNSKGTPVGQVRFEIRGKEAYISIGTAPERFGFGIGGTMVRLALAWLAQAHPRATAVALVRPENHISRKMFEHAGFSLTDRGLEPDTALRYESKQLR